MVDAVIHIGVQKSANTTLQAHFYPALKDVLFLGRFQRVSTLNFQTVVGSSYFLNEEVAGAIRQIEKHDMDFSLDSARVKEAFDGLYDANRHAAVLLSNEEISAFSGPNPITKLKRYRALFDNIKVIYCIRDQLELLKSLYLVKHRAEHFNVAGWDRQSWTPSFEQWTDINFRYCFSSLLASFNYHRMISSYRELVGEENLLVYDFEEFLRDPKDVMARLCVFMGVAVDQDAIAAAMVQNENIRPTKRLYAYSQLRRRLLPGVRLSRFLPKSLTWRFSSFLWASKKMQVTPEPETVERILQYYAADNAKLAAEMGFRLGANRSSGNFPGERG